MSDSTILCAKFKVNYVGKKSRIIKALFSDLADMEVTISELSEMSGIENIELQDYKSCGIQEGFDECRNFNKFPHPSKFPMRVKND